MPAWNTVFPSLLAICGASTEVYMRHITDGAGTVIGSTPDIRRDHEHRGRAAVLLAREMVRRLDADKYKTSHRGPQSGIFLHWPYRVLQEGGHWGDGTWLASQFCSESPRPVNQQSANRVWRGFPATPPNLAIDDIVADAGTLAADMAARQAAFIAQHAEHAAQTAELAAQCAATLAAARAAFVAELNTRFPDRGFA